MLDQLLHIDNEIFLLFNGTHWPYLDRFMMIFTSRFVWIPMYAAILFVIIRNNRPTRAMWTVLAIVLAIVLADQSCGHLIRPWVERLRPSNPSNPFSSMVHIVDGYRGGAYGFPSCHAANSFALACITTLVMRSRRVGLFIFIWAAVNSYSRLYLGVHYPGDLIAGAIAGCFCAIACYALLHCLVHGSSPDKALGQHLHTSDLVIVIGAIVVAGIAIAAI